MGNRSVLINHKVHKVRDETKCNGEASSMPVGHLPRAGTKILLLNIAAFEKKILKKLVAKNLQFSRHSRIGRNEFIFWLNSPLIFINNSVLLYLSRCSGKLFRLSGRQSVAETFNFVIKSFLTFFLYLICLTTKEPLP